MLQQEVAELRQEARGQNSSAKQLAAIISERDAEVQKTAQVCAGGRGAGSER